MRLLYLIEKITSATKNSKKYQNFEMGSCYWIKKMKALKGLLGSEKEWKQREDGVGVWVLWKKSGFEFDEAFLDQREGTGCVRVVDCCEQ